MPRTIVLAYSGGLDTSIIVPWLRENYDARVICVAADIGQDREELRGVRETAIASGAEAAHRPAPGGDRAPRRRRRAGARLHRKGE